MVPAFATRRSPAHVDRDRLGRLDDDPLTYLMRPMSASGRTARHPCPRRRPPIRALPV